MIVNRATALKLSGRQLSRLHFGRRAAARSCGLLVFLVLCAPCTGAAQSRGAEEVFRDAAAFTVEVRARITSPFDEDIQGVRQGAGFVIDAERGWILTNAHVASRSPSRVQVAYRGEGFIPATKLYVDPLIDLAVLEIGASARRTAAATASCGPPPEIGHPVGAFGHPWGQRFTATRGIVSRHATLARGAMLQTDAPINGGNSGGPLLSMATGQVVGINTAQLRGSQNLNFALPMPLACRIVAMLRQGQDPTPPKLLFQFYEDPEELGELRIAHLEPGAALSLRRGDIVLGVAGGIRVRDRVALLDALRGMTTFSLDILRDGLLLRAEVHARPETGPLSRRGIWFGGMLVAPGGSGDELIVHHVSPGSDADAKGFQYLDVIDLVEERPVRLLDDLRELIGNGPRTIRVSVRRPSPRQAGSTYYLRELQVDYTQTVSGTDDG